MLNIVISPSKLDVSADDFTLLAEVGKDSSYLGKFVYANKIWLFDKGLDFLSSEPTERKSNINMIRNELTKEPSVSDILMNWFGTCFILSLTQEEADEFVEFYNLAGDPDSLTVFAEEKLKSGVNIGRQMVINNLDMVISKIREEQ